MARCVTTPTRRRPVPVHPNLNIMPFRSGALQSDQTDGDAPCGIQGLSTQISHGQSGESPWPLPKKWRIPLKTCSILAEVGCWFAWRTGCSRARTITYYPVFHAELFAGVSSATCIPTPRKGVGIPTPPTDSHPFHRARIPFYGADCPRPPILILG